MIYAQLFRKVCSLFIIQNVLSTTQKYFTAKLNVYITSMWFEIKLIKYREDTLMTILLIWGRLKDIFKVLFKISYTMKIPSYTFVLFFRILA